MKTLVIFIFVVISLSFFSCENDGTINIKAELPIRTLGNGNFGDNNGSNGENKDDLDNLDDVDFNKLKEFSKFYLPNELLEQLTQGVKVRLHIISPNKQYDKFDVFNPQAFINKYETDTLQKVLSIKFDTFLEEGKNKLVVIQVGRKNNPLDNNDVNTGLMFIGADIMDIEKGKTYEPIELKPVINVKGKVLNFKNEVISARITSYPASIEKKDGKLRYSLKRSINTDSNGKFNLDSVYDVFQVEEKYRELYPKEYFNLLLVATADNNKKIGFSIVGKEYQDVNENDDDIYNGELYKEYQCYKYYGPESKCDNLDCNKNKDCFATQSGNFLPGVKIVNDIKVYSENERKDTVITSVSMPKFTKKFNPDKDPNASNIYYGNFFISGFNLDRLKVFEKQVNQLEASVKIYYSYKGKEIRSFYLKYDGPITLYNVDGLVGVLRKTNAQVLQNRLPFFKLCQSNISNESKCISVDLSNFDLSLNDGYNSFLGISGLEKLANNYTISKLEISYGSSKSTFILNTKEN